MKATTKGRAMYPGNGAAKCADKPAFIMAQTGEAKTFGARTKMR
jgi:hypothetical protein